MKFAGIADRIDTLDDGALRVVDYKTGAPHLEFDGVESLFTGTGKATPFEHPANALLYAMMLHRSRGCDVRTGALLRPQHEPPGYSPQLDDKQTGVKGARYTLYRERFEELLRAQLAETLRHLGSVPPVRGCRYLQVLRFQRDLQALTGCVVTGRTSSAAGW